MRHAILTFVSIFSVFGMLAGCSEEEPKKDQRRAELNEVWRQNAEIGPVAKTASATIEPSGKIEPVVFFSGPMPTGVAVSKSGRIFVCFPRWGDPVEFTVAEIINGKPVAFPNQNMQQLEKQEEDRTLVSVQSVVVDPQDRLWILDTGSVKMQEVKPGGPKLLCVDLNNNQIIKKIMFPDTVALSTTYLNEVRFDLARGEEGTAFITDSSDKGPNGIIVVDLKSGKSWRKLSGDPSTKADDNFTPMVEGKPLVVREPGQPEKYMKMGSDGIAIDVNKGVLYFCPLASRRLYRIKLDALMADKGDDQTLAALEQMPGRDFASDGLIFDRQSGLYLTDYEHNSIRRFDELSEKYDVLVSDPRMVWPDTMAIGADGFLYFTANQLNRQPRFNQGQDLRVKPYFLFRVPMNDARRTASAASFK